MGKLIGNRQIYHRFGHPKASDFGDIPKAESLPQDGRYSEQQILCNCMATAPTEKFEEAETADFYSKEKEADAPRKAITPMGNPILPRNQITFLPLENRGFGGNAPQGTEGFAQFLSGGMGAKPPWWGVG